MKTVYLLGRNAAIHLGKIQAVQHNDPFIDVYLLDSIVRVEATMSDYAKLATAWHKYTKWMQIPASKREHGKQSS